jgi:hypothetical protein
MNAQRAALLARAEALADLASERSEAQLLRAAVWLELRAAEHACAGMPERIALHYLLLAEHPEVRLQPGLAGRYARRAWRWAERAERGLPPPSGGAFRQLDDA